MKVKMLGTGSIYSKSNCASVLINNNILVDIGPGVVKQLLKEKDSLEKLDTILITHLHSDHILDFPTFIVNREVLGNHHIISIYGPKGTKEKLLSLLQLMYGNYFDEFITTYFRFIVIKDNDILNIDNHCISVKEVIHTGIESYGFIIDSKLGITGDSSLCDGVKEIFNHCHIMIWDCSAIHGDIYHMGIDNIQEMLKINHKKEMILTHFRDHTKETVKGMHLNHVFVVEDGYEFYVE